MPSSRPPSRPPRGDSAGRPPRGPGRGDFSGPPRERSGPPRDRKGPPRERKGPVVRTWQAPVDEDGEDFAPRSTEPAIEGSMSLTLPSALAGRLRSAARKIGTDPEALATVLLGQQVLALGD
ncbi:MAG: hypothetical protein VKO21_00405 [Candidatus Sericytochromatia bacterium]|nr:hypothetical protein [Candidatus Sericytochromatia bacterium]